MSSLRAVLIHLLLATSANWLFVEMVANAQDSQRLEENIHRQLAQLRSDQFSARQLATEQLIEIGAPALPFIARSLNHMDADSRKRMMMHLRTMSTVESAETQLIAQQSLAVAADSKNNRVAREAKNVLRDISIWHQQRATNRLMDLGATIVLQDLIHRGHQFRVPYSIQIDKTWRGETSDLLLVRNLIDTVEMTLDHPHVTNDVLAQFTDKHEIEFLRIKHASITDAGIESLLTIPDLNKLDIYYTNITQHALKHVYRLPSIVAVRFYGTQIPITRMSEIRQFVHGDVDVRQGAFLGIKYTRGSSICKLSSVVTNSGAYRAGLRAGDLLTEINGSPVLEPLDLTKILRTIKASEKARIKLMRNQRVLEFEVQLGEWE